jgi:hypothetical protein
MPIAVKDATTSAQKFVQRAQAAAPDYQKGVQAAGPAWQQNATAANDSYVQGVTAAANAGRYAKGVNAAGAQKYADKASTVGAQRFPQGVAAAGPDWQNKTSPFLQTIASLNLPARRPKGDPANIQRVQMITDALRKKKLGG